MVDIDIPFQGKPAILQATRASKMSHESSQTVPHSPKWQISTRPSIEVGPSMKRIWPLVQTGWQYKPTSRWWPQHESEPAQSVR